MTFEKTSYNNNFTHDLKWGKVHENTVAEIVEGDKTEVKSERDIWARTNNHFVEFSSRDHPSGVLTTEAKWWTVNFIHRDKFCFNLTIAVKELIPLMKDGHKNKKWKKVKGGDNNSSLGILVPISALMSIR